MFFGRLYTLKFFDELNVKSFPCFLIPNFRKNKKNVTKFKGCPNQYFEPFGAWCGYNFGRSRFWGFSDFFS